MISLINIISIFNLIALAILIAFRKQNIFANRILGLSLLCSASDFIVNFLSYKGILDDFPYFVFFNFSFLWAPLVYLYVLMTLEIRLKFKFKYYVHFAPQLLSFSYWFYMFSLGEQQLDILLTNRHNSIYSWQLQSFQIIIMLQSIFYLGYSAYLIHKKQADKDFNHVPRIRLEWLKQFIWVLIGLIFTLIVSSFLVTSVIIDYIITPILYGISNVFLVYKSLNSSGIFTNITVSDYALSKDRYSGSNLKPENILDYKSKLLHYLDKEEFFTNPEFTINNLSEETGIQVHHLSQIINQELGKNFFDLINSYRIEKAKSLMIDSKNANLTLEAIGYKSGFGSTSSFYRSFKKQTGFTPRAFLKNQKNQPI